jgi:hypothetical protein
MIWNVRLFNLLMGMELSMGHQTSVKFRIILVTCPQLKTESMIRIVLFLLVVILFFPNYSFGQAKDLIDKNEVISALTKKYQNIGPKTVSEMWQLESLYKVTVDKESDDPDVECVSKALNYSTTLIEQGRIIAGMKMSAKTTISLFGGTLGKFGFKYAVDGAKLLSLLDDAAEAGGDAEDYARAVAQFAYDKGSGMLFDKFKDKYPDMLSDETVKSQALSEMADQVKSAADGFMTKLLEPKKKELFNHSCKGGNCDEKYIGTLQKNEGLVDDHVGPVLVMEVTVSCSCPAGKNRPLKNSVVTYTIPLDLVENPKAKDQWWFQSIPHYKYVANMKKAHVLVKADCCDKSDKKDDSNISWEEPDKDTYISIGFNSLVDTYNGSAGFKLVTQAGMQHNFRGSHHAGVEFGPQFAGNLNLNSSFKNRNNGGLATLYYLYDIISMFNGYFNVYTKTGLSGGFSTSKSFDSNGAGMWMENGNNRNISAFVAPGLRFERISWAVNADVNIASWATNTYVPKDPQFTESTSRTFFWGTQAQPFQVRFLWRLR